MILTGKKPNLAKKGAAIGPPNKAIKTASAKIPPQLLGLFFKEKL